MNRFRIVLGAAMFAALALGANAQDATCDRNHYILLDHVGGWLPTGNLNVPRSGHTATLLPDGTVLVVGGWSMDAATKAIVKLDSAELYDPATGIWTPTGSLATPRSGHTATLLSTGKVLVAGGDETYLSPGLGLGGTTELYDPTTGSWSATGNLNIPRIDFTATVLTNGKVLVAGGVDNQNEILSSAELYDPATGGWSFTGDLITARFFHTATPLQDGRILVAGGWIFDDIFGGSVTADAEVYDPSVGSWSSTSGLHDFRDFQTATRLQDGHVLVAGGYGTAELYDSVAGTWTTVGDLDANKLLDFHTATLLPDGEVLVAGGLEIWRALNEWFNLNLNGAELYDPVHATWANTGSLISARSNHTATLLPDGRVLVAGGTFVTPNWVGLPLGSAELYGDSGCP
jgi:hypothetical protein